MPRRLLKSKAERLLTLSSWLKGSRKSWALKQIIGARLIHPRAEFPPDTVHALKSNDHITVEADGEVTTQ